LEAPVTTATFPANLLLLLICFVLILFTDGFDC
jgi:hypothetical protein